MKIELKNVSKSFLGTPILNHFNLQICSGERYAILGANGSGKSTLLGIIGGLIKPNSGEIQFSSKNGEVIEEEQAYKKISLTGPYIHLVDDFNLLELINLHLQFKTTYNKYTTIEFAQECNFSPKHYNILFKNFSSGMRQRLKLGFAILVKSEILLLDEPFTNLDAVSKQWYKGLLEDNLNGRTLVIASNDLEEYSNCHHKITPWS